MKRTIYSRFTAGAATDSPLYFGDLIFQVPICGTVKPPNLSWPSMQLESFLLGCQTQLPGEIMRYIVYSSVVVLFASSLAYATVQNSDGQVGVDPVFDSQDASIVITGPAAMQLYIHLSVTASKSEVKIGKNIMCRKSLNNGSGKSDSYECQMYVSPDGTVQSAND